MNDIIQTFMFEDISIRTTVRDGETWFANVDVCVALGISNPSQALTRLDEDEKDLISNEGQYYGIVNESGLYSLVLGSRKPEAKRFKKWVTSEVIPSIRKTGSYSIKSALPDFSNPVAAARAWADEVEQKQLAQQQLAIAAPKAEFYDAVTQSDDCIDMAQVAKVLNIKGLGRNNLFQLLRDKKVLRKNNQPYQKHVDADHMRLVETSWTDGNGDTHVRTKTVVLQKGLDYIRKLVEKEL